MGPKYLPCWNEKEMSKWTSQLNWPLAWGQMCTKFSGCISWLSREERGEQHVKCKTQGGHYIKEVKSQPSKADVQLCTEILEDSRSQSSRRGVTTQAGRSDVKSHVQIAGPCKSEVICTPPGLTATHRCGGKLTSGSANSCTCDAYEIGHLHRYPHYQRVTEQPETTGLAAAPELANCKSWQTKIS